MYTAATREATAVAPVQRTPVSLLPNRPPLPGPLRQAALATATQGQDRADTAPSDPPTRADGRPSSIRANRAVGA